MTNIIFYENRYSVPRFDGETHSISCLLPKKWITSLHFSKIHIKFIRTINLRTFSKKNRRTNFCDHRIKSRKYAAFFPLWSVKVWSCTLFGDHMTRPEKKGNSIFLSRPRGKKSLNTRLFFHAVCAKNGILPFFGTSHLQMEAPSSYLLPDITLLGIGLSFFKCTGGQVPESMIFLFREGFESFGKYWWTKSAFF